MYTIRCNRCQCVWQATVGLRTAPCPFCGSTGSKDLSKMKVRETDDGDAD
jgi:hypothetical protein